MLHVRLDKIQQDRQTLIEWHVTKLANLTQDGRDLVLVQSHHQLTRFILRQHRNDNGDFT